MQGFVLDPAMVDVMETLPDAPALSRPRSDGAERPPLWGDRTIICTWIGENIHVVNEALRCCLEACHECFYPQMRPDTRIFAVPLAQTFGLDGLCNISITPITILIDAGRVTPENWLSIVAHEYVHAYLGSPGHGKDFAAVLSHLCLGLGLETPPEQMDATSLRSWPPYPSISDPLAFWRGVT
ncbi:MAG: hypothetical protein HC862_13160 [Scytonema sp. RU_4_4]|nr:hypothetical protein [Scytonema sp. RU_4_4]NJR74244.1 hypothetical protein [Scytonema sp. CRU_2_7]